MPKNKRKPSAPPSVAPSTPAPSARRPLVWGVLLLGVFLVGVLTWVFWPSPSSRIALPPKPYEAPADAALPNRMDNQSYVGAARCQECHAKEFESWSKHPHSAAMKPASPETILGDFQSQSFTEDGIFAKMRTEGSSYFFEVYDQNSQLVQAKVDFVLGNQRRQEYLTKLPDGRLQVLPLAFSLASRRWFAPLTASLGEIPKDSAFYWTNSRRTFNRECYDCHLTEMKTRYDAAKDSYETTWQDVGVSCEACHGPGQAHAAKPSKENIIAPLSLSQERQAALCGRCHSQRVPHFSIYNEQNRFVPGDLFEDFFWPVLPGQLGSNGELVFYPDGRPKLIGMEYQGLLQSRCYLNSRMTCSTCHPSHEAQKPSDTVCGGCHPSQFAEPQKHAKHQEVSCVSCHMPKVIPAPFGKATDHSIGVPDPDGTRDLDIPSACVQCHNDKPASWSSAGLRSLYSGKGPSRRGKLAALFLGASEPEKAKQLEDELILLFEDPKESLLLRATAASALSGFRDPKSVKALSAGLQDPSILIRGSSASALATLGKDRAFDEARASLVSALEDSNVWVRLQAATSLYSMADPRGLSGLEALARMPSYQSWFRVRAMFVISGMQQNKLDEAQEECRIALLDKPDFTQLYRSLAQIFTYQNQTERAKEQWRLLLRFDPSDKEAKAALSQ